MNLNDLTTDYLQYCKSNRQLDDLTIKSYRIDLNQFIFTLHAIMRLGTPLVFLMVFPNLILYYLQNDSVAA